MLGLHHANHAALRVNDGKRVKVVLVEHLGQFVLLHVRRAGDDAGLGQDAQARFRLSHDQARQRNGTAKQALLVEQKDFGHALRIAVETAQRLHGLRNGCIHAQVDEFRGHAAGCGVFVELEQLLDLLPLLRLHLLEDGVGLFLRAVRRADRPRRRGPFPPRCRRCALRRAFRAAPFAAWARPLPASRRPPLRRAR